MRTADDARRLPEGGTVQVEANRAIASLLAENERLWYTLALIEDHLSTVTENTAQSRMRDLIADSLRRASAALKVTP